MSSAVSVKHLHVRKGKTVAVDGVSFELQRGTITGLIGPSGSGKTTLMRTLVGAQIFQNGEVIILGHEAGSADLRPRIGYVTQSPAVYHDLTTEQNLKYFGRIVGAPRRQIGELLERLDLTRQRKQLAGDLSGGQLARASLAVALLGDPEFLILDEPTVGQDPVLRDELWDFFRELADDGKTLLVSSHIMNEASHCDRLLVMRQGKLVADTTAKGLMNGTRTTDLDDAFLALIRRTIQ
jgi:ABC-2 type transport system ATP-binding protein